MTNYTTFKAGSTTGHRTHTGAKMPYCIEGVVDFSKQNGLAGTDTFEVLNIPAGTLILSAVAEVLTVATGVTTPTFDVGFTGGDVDEFVDGGDLAVAGLYYTLQSPINIFITTADTIDLLLLGTGTATAGKVRVSALVCDMTGVNTPATGDWG